MIFNPTCTSLAFYDLDISNIDVLGLFKFTELWMKSFGYEPKRGSFHSINYTSSKTKTFKFIKNKTLSDNVNNINTIYFSSYQDSWDTDMLDGVLSFRISMEKRGSFCIYYSEDVVNYKYEDLKIFVKNILNFLSARYGIVFRREINKGPDMYVMGIGVNLEDSIQKEKIESEKIGKWYRAYSFEDGTYKTGMLRDIYPMNFISKIHLDQPVYGGSLQQWIESSSLHGELEKFNESLWLWTVPENKTESIANDLKDTGLIVSLRD